MGDNLLYYGDNLPILRDRIKDESVDLIYLDPPFNSKQVYNVIFDEKNGSPSVSQSRAFDDTWHWRDRKSQEVYQEIARFGGKVSNAIIAFHELLGGSDMLAYLSMMALRLVELRRVLKPTGSVYLHCDPTASHYLKLLMDAVFGPLNFQNEIIWKRTSGHSDAERCGDVHDTLLFYSKEESYTWNKTYQAYDPDYVEQYYRYQDPDGRRFMSGDLSASGLQGGGYEYIWKGVTRVWRCPLETMERLEKEGRIFYTRNGMPRLKRYLDEMPGMPLQDVWNDIEALRSWHKERLGYPTQKPQKLLERIIEVSSNEGDLLLDPFCGCGSAIMAAQQLKRRWVGIDITYVAIAHIKQRLADTFGDNALYEEIGQPASLPDAQALASVDKYEFQWWVLEKLGARHFNDVRKKGADRGIDGKLIFFDDDSGKAKQIILSVKGGATGVKDVRDLKAVVEREKAQIGVLVSIQEPTQPMRDEAAESDVYISSWGQHPKIQLLSVDQIFNGKRIDYPPAKQVNATYKKAPKHKGKSSQKKNLFDSNDQEEE